MRKIGNSEFSTKPTNYYNLDLMYEKYINDETLPLTDLDK